MTNELEKKQKNAVEEFNMKGIVVSLKSMMDKLVEKECNAGNVNAACNCASRIVDIIRVHLEAEKVKLKRLD